jgi:GDP-L-fucose synthase
MNKKILVTGGSGMLGKAMQKLLPGAVYLSSKDADLTNSAATDAIFNKHKPEFVVHLAGRVGGIKANMNNLGKFYYDNIQINTNVLESSRKHNVQKVLSMLSTCVYPDATNYPLREDTIHNGPPHHSNYAYAYAKRMVDVQSKAYRQQYGCNFITAIPNNIFGPNDNFDLEDSHVIPALIRKIYEAKKFGKEVILWGDGTPLREFTHSYDMAKIILFVLKNYSSPEPINIGNTNEFSIKQIANMVCSIYNYDGKIIWDTTGPPGQFRKPSSNEKLLQLGWDENDFMSMQYSLEQVCDWFDKNYSMARGVSI